jgi:NAD(P)-dependent dehydrogenase (short-subunit alcohol dehydrogenase family)
MASPRIVTKFEQIVSGKLLKGKVALVTGASRGAGRGIALVLGECGATVITTGRSMAGKTTDNRPETVEETAKLVTERGGQGVAIHCDHSNAAEVKNLFERVIKDYGRLDILVNNAWSGNKGYDGEKYTDGTRFDTPFWEGHALNRWHDMIDVRH